MGTTLSLIIFAILFCLVVCGYFFGHWIKKGTIYLWHTMAGGLHLRLPWRHEH